MHGAVVGGGRGGEGQLFQVGTWGSSWGPGFVKAGSSPLSMIRSRSIGIVIARVFGELPSLQIFSRGDVLGRQDV